MTHPPLSPDARCAPAPDRAILRLEGEDREKFLQGLVTQDVRLAQRDGLAYAAMLTPQGKLIADFLIVAPPDAPEALLIDVFAPLAADLARRLMMFRLRSKVSVTLTDLPVTRGLGPPRPARWPIRATRRSAGAFMARRWRRARRSTGTRCASPPWSPRPAPNSSPVTASSWNWGSNACTASISAKAATSARRSPPACTTRPTCAADCAA